MEQAELDKQVLLVELVAQVKQAELVDLWQSPMMERTEY